MDKLTIEIPLQHTNLLAIIDIEDSEKVLQYPKWWLHEKGYVYTRVYYTGYISKKLYLHRLVMDAKGKIQIDHINRNKLDCRKANLRFATFSQNNFNREKIEGKCKYKGVYRHSVNNKFIAQCSFNGTKKYLGSFDTEEEAARAYDEYVKKLGELTVLNSPQ